MCAGRHSGVALGWLDLDLNPDFRGCKANLVDQSENGLSRCLDSEPQLVDEAQKMEMGLR